MDLKNTKKVLQDGEIEEVRPADERLQMLLQGDLVDFFSLYFVINQRLRWLLDVYQFKDFADLQRYYNDYVRPKLEENESEFENE